MEVSALEHAAVPRLSPRSPLLRLQSDERLIALVRRGNHGAFEALVGRYESRLLSFCRHMLGSREDAEDVLQEVFAAAFNAILADDRPINVRPWLYRIARNRSLNHLRRTQAVGVDTLDHHEAEHGITTAEKVHRREDFRQLVADMQDLPESQRTALLLRELDALSYEQIAEAMETTVPAVKSLLVRARVSLAEAAESRLLSCEAVREELAEVAEGLRRTTAPARRHVRTCERCATFRKQLRETNKALAAVYPVAPLLLLKKTLLAHLGTTAAAGGGSAAVATGGACTTTGVLQACAAGVATKAAAGLAAAAIVTAGAVEVKHVAVHHARAPQPPPAVAPAAATAPLAAPLQAASPSLLTRPVAEKPAKPEAAAERPPQAEATPAATATPTPTATPAQTATPAATPAATATPAPTAAASTIATPAPAPAGTPAPAADGGPDAVPLPPTAAPAPPVATPEAQDPVPAPAATPAPSPAGADVAPQGF